MEGKGHTGMGDMDARVPQGLWKDLESQEVKELWSLESGRGGGRQRRT